VVGYASIDLDLLDDASAAFGRARDLFVLNQSHHYALDGDAGLGLVEHLKRNHEAAIAHVAHIPDFPGLIELLDELDFGYAALASTHLILSSAGDRRADRLVMAAAARVQQLLQAVPSDEARKATLDTNAGYRWLLAAAGIGPQSSVSAMTPAGGDS
jgi:hypothetical protein